MSMNESEAKRFLLDASCFYALGSDEQKRLSLRAAVSSATTSILAAIDISNVGDTEEDFMRRKAAMRTLTAICPNPIAEYPDDIVASAFGRPEPGSTPFVFRDIARAFELASSRDEAVRGVKDPVNGKRIRLNPAACAAWKSEIAERYRRAIMLGNRYIKDFVRDDNSEAVSAEPAAEPDVLSDGPEDRFMSLFGLAIRAGLLAECEARYRSNYVAVAAEFIPLVSQRYKGKLEPYISMELAYRKSLAPGEEPECDAVFELEHFLYLDARNVGYTFVTAEDRWVNLGRYALPGRVMALEAL